MNPLDKAGEAYSFEAMNPNPGASKTKDGPKYRISYEVTQEVFLDHMDASTAGAIFNVAVVRQDSPALEQRPVQKPKGSMTHLSNVAAMLGENPKFGQWFKVELSGTHELAKDSFEGKWDDLTYKEKCRECIIFACSIPSRSYLDADDIAANAFKTLIAEPFNLYVAEH